MYMEIKIFFALVQAWMSLKKMPHNHLMKIAVVGSGISGLSAAYYLSKKHHVDLFEKEDHFGGHSHTIDLSFGLKKVSVDIGFIVFNFATYPHLINFFDENNIAIEKSDMVFFCVS